jgi:hypothetical protein
MTCSMLSKRISAEPRPIDDLPCRHPAPGRAGLADEMAEVETDEGESI